MTSGFRNIYPDPIVSAHVRNLVYGYPTYQELAKLRVPGAQLPNPRVTPLVRRLVLSYCSEQLSWIHSPRSWDLLMCLSSL